MLRRVGKSVAWTIIALSLVNGVLLGLRVLSQIPTQGSYVGVLLLATSWMGILFEFVMGLGIGVGLLVLLNIDGGRLESQRSGGGGGYEDGDATMGAR